MARHSADSDARAWMIVFGHLLLISARAASNWFVLVLLSLIPGVVAGGLTYLLLNDITADPQLSAVTGGIVMLVATATAVYALARLGMND